jgi:NADPH:quinone reductase-like Zn-dependent oxidoreductase
MTRRAKVLSVVSIVLAVVLLTAAVLLSHDSPCAASPPLPANTAAMKAAVHRCYGPPDVVRIESMAKPAPGDKGILVKVHAASVNPLDWHMIRGNPYFMRMMGLGLGSPQDVGVGVDFAGTVEAVGKSETLFKPGDAVFGGWGGTLAEYLSLSEDAALALKPPNMTFEQAASAPVAALTALQAFRDKGKLQAGQKVLINGASGGVGTFAVQIAKSYGADVTGVTSTRNVELVRSLGAQHVIDYTHEDYTTGPQRYDLLLDLVGSHSFLENRRVLQPKGIYIGVGGGSPEEGGFLGPMTSALKLVVLSPFVSQKGEFFVASLNKEDLTQVASLMQAGTVTPVIDKRYPLDETVAALRYLERGHARGKIIVTMDAAAPGHSEGPTSSPSP